MLSLLLYLKFLVQLPDQANPSPSHSSKTVVGVRSENNDFESAAV